MKILLPLMVSLFISGSAYSIEFDKSVPKNIQDQMKQDLNFINSVKLTGQTGLHSKIFGEKIDGAYKKYLETRISNVRYDDDPTSNVLAYVKEDVDNTMFLANNYMKYQVPQVMRIMTVYHEARHTEAKNKYWRHAICPTPFIGEDGKKVEGIVSGMTLAGLKACDTTNLGAYATGSILLKNVAKYCENCSEKVKMDADLYAMDMMKRIINKKARDEMKKDFKEVQL
jgi:hypothetical protein